MRKPRILVVADYYLPGFRAGGPIRAISNSIRALADEAEFFVVTRDHDADGTRHRGIQPERWHAGPAGTVYYAPVLTRRAILECVRSSGCDLIWLNSFFSRATLRVLGLKRIGRIHQPLVLAPRGEFSPGALGLKYWRKAAVIAALRMSGCLRSIQWLASSDLEREEITTVTRSTLVTCVPERVSDVPAADGWLVKRSGTLRAVFASRIAPKKNLLFLLEVLARLDGNVRLDVIGPMDDPAYWAQCLARIARLRPNIECHYRGEAPHSELLRRLRDYDFMVLPTYGENFGHIVVESWAAGCPVILSDRTPWRNLQAQGIGWDLPLDHSAWAGVLRECLDMDGDRHMVMRKRAVERARRAWQDGVNGDESLRALMLAGAPVATRCA